MLSSHFLPGIAMESFARWLEEVLVRGELAKLRGRYQLNRGVFDDLLLTVGMLIDLAIRLGVRSHVGLVFVIG